jgi:hypothetical protein
MKDMTITVKGFYRIAVLLPIAIPVLLLPFNASFLSAVLLLSAWVGGLAYIAFALFVLFLIGRIQGETKIGVLIWSSPLIFLPFSMVGWIVQQVVARFFNPDLVLNAADLLPISVFSILVGYAYVLFVQFTFFMLRLMKIIRRS